MSISLQWTDEHQTVLLCTIVNPWTLEELMSIARTAAQGADHHDHPIASLIVFEGKLEIPPRFLLSVPDLFRLIPTHHNLHVVVTNDPLALTIHGIMQKVHPELSQQMVIVETLAAGYEVLGRRSQSVG